MEPSASSLKKEKLEKEQAAMRARFAEPPPSDRPFIERHYTVKQFADLLQLSPDSIYRLLKEERGIIRLGHPETARRRSYVTLRIPESVGRRIYARLLQWGVKPLSPRTPRNAKPLNSVEARK